MQKFLLLFVLLTSSLHLGFSQKNHVRETPQSDGMETFIEDVDRINSEIHEFYQHCKEWDNGVVRAQVEEINALQAQIKRITSQVYSGNEEIEKEFWKSYNQCVKLYNEVQFARAVLAARAEKENEWETSYFQLWEEILYKKDMIDQLYIEKKVNSGSKSIGYDRENKVIRKRRLYFAWNDVYDSFLKDMKRTQQYETRISIENKILVLLNKVEDLAFATTRDLEKSLKTAVNPEDKYQLIIDYKADS